MSKNSYVVVIVVLLLAVGGFVLLNQSRQTPVEEETETEEVMEKEEEEKAGDSAAMEEDETVEKEEEVMEKENGEDEDVIEKTTHEVSYTDTGFSPDTWTVNAGDTVTWTNNSSGTMWVASAVHPTHELLPDFDQLEAVAAGETYEFTFDEVGSYPYHNHVAPENIGTIEVE
jgi:plastocyanin